MASGRECKCLRITRVGLLQCASPPTASSWLLEATTYLINQPLQLQRGKCARRFRVADFPRAEISVSATTAALHQVTHMRRVHPPSRCQAGTRLLHTGSLPAWFDHHRFPTLAQKGSINVEGKQRPRPRQLAVHLKVILSYHNLVTRDINRSISEFPIISGTLTYLYSRHPSYSH